MAVTIGSRGRERAAAEPEDDRPDRDGESNRDPCDLRTVASCYTPGARSQPAAVGLVSCATLVPEAMADMTRIFLTTGIGCSLLLAAASCSAPTDSEGPSTLSDNGNSSTDGNNTANDPNTPMGMAIVNDDDTQVFLSDEDDPNGASSSGNPNGFGMGNADLTDGVNTGCGSNLIGLIRDFHDTHPDMEVCSEKKASPRECAHETGIVAPQLGDDEKPVYAGDPAAGTLSTTGQANFDQWFRDVEGVNTPFEFSLNFQETETGTFVFDSDFPPEGSPAGFYPGPNNVPPGGFFPIDDLNQDGFKMQSLLYPEYQDNWYFHNYHFTFEFVTEFVYNGGEQFTFTGDDDVFVYINRQLVVDLGGIHQKLESTVDVDTEAARLGLTVGETYPVHFFFAERHETESNFRIETSLVFINCKRPRAK